MSDLSPLIVGVSGLVLTSQEVAFLERTRPLGIILFARNVDSAGQVRELLSHAQAASGAPFTLVDQEGGRVQRAKPPLAALQPAAATVGAAARALADPAKAERLGWLSGRVLAGDVAALGFNVPCLPVCDVLAEGATDAIGDRAYSGDPQHVATLAGAVAGGVLAAGCLPVIKHMPGHGRATADSHFHLPTVRADREALERDFHPFRALSHLPLAMSAHVRFSAIDDRAATLSPVVIDSVIRRSIGFDGFLMTDDISMRALSGRIGERAVAALEAGCDCVLHCNGKMSEMEAVAEALPAMGGEAARRFAAARAALTADDGGDLEALRAEYAGLLAHAGFTVHA